MLLFGNCNYFHLTRVAHQGPVWCFQRQKHKLMSVCSSSNLKLWWKPSPFLALDTKSAIFPLFWEASPVSPVARKPCNMSMSKPMPPRGDYQIKILQLKSLMISIKEQTPKPDFPQPLSWVDLCSVSKSWARSHLELLRTQDTSTKQSLYSFPGRFPFFLPPGRFLHQP
jgi:hypothetical protein